MGQQGHEIGGVLALPTAFNEDNNWVTVETGARHTCALKDDGSLWCWGGNHDGNLANSDDIESLTKCEADNTSAEVLCVSTTPIQIEPDRTWAKIELAGNIPAPSMTTTSYGVGVRIHQDRWVMVLKLTDLNPTKFPMVLGNTCCGR